MPHPQVGTVGGGSLSRVPTCRLVGMPKARRRPELLVNTAAFIACNRVAVRVQTPNPRSPFSGLPDRSPSQGSRACCYCFVSTVESRRFAKVPHSHKWRHHLAALVLRRKQSIR